MGYNRKQGIVKQTGAEQYTMRLNATKKIFKNFSVGTKTNLAYISSSMTQGMSTTNLSDGSSMMRSMMVTRPYMMASMAEEVDDLDENNHVGSTPVRWLADFQSLRKEFRITPHVFIDWKITDWLEFKSSVPSIAAGWFLIFIPSFYELSMTALLYSNNTKTIGFQLYEYWTFTSQQQASAMAFGILLIVVAINFLLNKLTKGEFSI